MAQNLKKWCCSEIVRFHCSNVVKTSNEVSCYLTEGGAKSDRWCCSEIVRFHHSNVVKTLNEVFYNLSEYGSKSERVALLSCSEIVGSQ